MERDESHLVDMLNAARASVQFLGDADHKALRGNAQMRSSILYQLVVLGEAAKRVSLEFKGCHPDIPWKRIAGLRDRVVHDYNQVDHLQIWNIIHGEIPKLLRFLESVVPKGED